MLKQKRRGVRKGSVLVEYALLIAGIVLVSVVAIAVLGIAAPLVRLGVAVSRTAARPHRR